MTRDEALGLYPPVSAGIQRVFKAAAGVCSRSDWTRAAKHLGAGSEGTIVVADDSTINMIADVALFEPDRNGRRPYDGFSRDRPASSRRRTATSPRAWQGLLLGLPGHRPPRSRGRLGRGRHEREPAHLDPRRRAREIGAGRPDVRDAPLRAGAFHAGFSIVIPVEAEYAGFLAEAAGLRSPALPAALACRAPLWREDRRILLTSSLPSQRKRSSPRNGPG